LSAQISDLNTKLRLHDDKSVYHAQSEREYHTLLARLHELEDKLRIARETEVTEIRQEGTVVTEEKTVVQEGNVAELEANIKLLVVENERLNRELHSRETANAETVVSPNRKYEVVETHTHPASNRMIERVTESRLHAPNYTNSYVVDGHSGHYVDPVRVSHSGVRVSHSGVRVSHGTHGGYVTGSHTHGTVVRSSHHNTENK